ncbi:hypothetical protein ACFFWD_16530 [Bradyrhizobium erythrophlei]|uniref:hypothetical protein n=1 Tax=Bradyrhizobium erythrophlei TaxID=1437360 RepID=UPI0035E4D415
MDSLPDHHQSGLESSGYLRIGITTYLGGRPSQWVENKKSKIDQFLPEIVGAIIAAGPALEQAKREREERERRYREDEARRSEARRLKEIDDKRWSKFRELAINWDERKKLLAFLVELEARLVAEGNVTVSDRTLSEWIEWAKTKAELLNPFGAGTAEMFQAIANVPAWSYPR